MWGCVSIISKTCMVHLTMRHPLYPRVWVTDISPDASTIDDTIAAHKCTAQRYCDAKRAQTKQLGVRHRFKGGARPTFTLQLRSAGSMCFVLYKNRPKPRVTRFTLRFKFSSSPTTPQQQYSQPSRQQSPELSYESQISAVSKRWRILTLHNQPTNLPLPDVRNTQ